MPLYIFKTEGRTLPTGVGFGIGSSGPLLRLNSQPNVRASNNNNAVGERRSSVRAAANNNNNNTNNNISLYQQRRNEQAARAMNRPTAGNNNNQPQRTFRNTQLDSSNSEMLAEQPHFHNHGTVGSLVVGAAIGLAALVGHGILKLLTKEDLERIPTERATKAFVDEKKECPVCFESFKLNEDIKTLPCAHVYHLNCINEWIIRNPNCPLCRQRLDA